MKRLFRGLALAMAAGLLLGLAGPASAQEPEFSYEPLVPGKNAAEACKNSNDTVVVQPFGFPLELGSRGACVSTLVHDELSAAAYVANCKALEPLVAMEGESGRPYPYAFYGNPAYTARNRADCVYFLRAFHTGALPPGGPGGE